MFYELATSDSGSGSPVVLLHAFPCDRSMWVAQTRALTDAGFRVIAPDLPGFGESPVSTATPELGIAAQAVFDLLDDRALSSAPVVGLSMGGYVAMEMVRQQPGRISGLGLVDTKASSDPGATRQHRRNVADEVLAAGSARSLLAMMPQLLGETTRADRPDVVASVESFIDRAPPEAVAWAQRAMAERPDSLGTLESFAGPSLVMFGEEDTLSPRTDQDSMIEALTGAEVVSIPGTGHLSALEAPEVVSERLVGWLVSG